MSWGYGTLATEVYDLRKPIGSSFGDVEFYRRLLDGIDGRVLEPAVGAGRVLIPLIEAGFRVEGYDSSPQMLALCRQRCVERGIDAVLFAADMTSFAAAETYSAVILPAGSITLLAGRHELTRALRCFHRSLKVGGRWTDGVLDATELQIFRLQHWSIEEFAGLLRQTGFEDVVISADYSLDADPAPGSDIWTFASTRA